MKEPSINRYRHFLKDTIRRAIDFSQTDQHQGVAPPPIEKPFEPGDTRIDLPEVGEWKGIGTLDLTTAIAGRESRRTFKQGPLTMDELSFLLWATQGVRALQGSGTVMRTVPSAGNRHSFETYLAVLRVAGLKPAFYRYLPLENQLLYLFQEDQAPARLVDAALGQTFVGRSAVVFIWTTIPYRMEWRYGAAAHKTIALDAGHVCQNLYLACEVIKAGTCAIAAYHQEQMDELLRVDGEEEFTVYVAPVGKV